MNALHPPAHTRIQRKVLAGGLLRHVSLGEYREPAKLAFGWLLAILSAMAECLNLSDTLAEK